MSSIKATSFDLVVLLVFLKMNLNWNPFNIAAYGQKTVRKMPRVQQRNGAFQ